MWSCFWASWMTPTSDWLMTAVGPPAWPTTALPVLSSCSWMHLASDRLSAWPRSADSSACTGWSGVRPARGETRILPRALDESSVHRRP